MKVNYTVLILKSQQKISESRLFLTDYMVHCISNFALKCLVFSISGHPLVV